MQKILKILNSIIDFLYHPFEKYIPKDIFRYAFCGGGNLVFDWVLYFFIYNFILRHEMLNLGFVVISSHIATKCIVFPITTITGFLLNKYITFTQSSLSTPTQFVRYISVVGLNLAINYFGLKLLVDVLGIYPTPSNIIISLFTILISFLAQKFFTFKK